MTARCAGWRGAVAVLAALAVAPALAACSSPIRADRLDAVVGPTFARLYAQQQSALDHVLPPRGPDGAAQCGRGGSLSSGSGAGDDWACAVVFPFADGHLQPITYDLTVSATGCFTADGPSAVVGRQTLTTPAGDVVPNPLFAFDGCLDLG